MISKYKTIALGLMVAACTITSCSDDYMAEVNTDTSKAEVVNPNSLLTTALLEPYGDFGLMDTYRSYITGFTQHFAGGWNVTSYAGSVYKKDDQMSGIWNKYYAVGLKNLTAGLDNSKDRPNLNAIMRIHRVYMYSILTDTYGDVPCFNACKGIATPEYDSQEKIYDWFFTELAEAVQQLGTGSDLVTGDVTTLNGKAEAWKKYANSLRMRFAMRISDVNPTKAKEEFVKAMKADGGYISKLEENAYVNFLDVPFTLYPGSVDLDFRANALSEIMYGQDREAPSMIASTLFEQLQSTNDPRMWRICRYFHNARRGDTRPDAENVDVTDDVIAFLGADINKYVCNPGTAWYDNPNEDWGTPDIANFPTLKRKAASDPSFNLTLANCHIRMKYPFYNVDMERPQTPGVLMTSAEVKFLIAEAISKGWVDGDVKTYFEDGIWDAMHMLNETCLASSDSYAKKISDTEIQNYIAGLGVDVTNNAREVINTQAWILHLTNPSECWANLRRADYPVLKDRKNLPTYGAFPHDSDLTTPLRLCYPQAEAEVNSVNYKAALAKIGSTDEEGKTVDDWHKPVWWDKNPQNFK